MEQEYTTSILESMLDAVIVANPDGTIRTVNRAALELLGYTEEELIGQPVGTIFEEEEEEEEEAFFRGTGLAQLVREGAARNVELTLRAKSGERIPVMFNGSVIQEEDGRLAAVVGVARDMRERKRAEEALRATKERLHYLVSSSPAVIYTSKASGDYGATFISENVTAQLGYEPREFIEDSGFWASHIHPEDAPRVFAGLSRLFEHGHHIYEYRFLHKDGTYRWMRDELKLVWDAEGKPVEIIGYWIDITERKRAVEETAHGQRLLLALSHAAQAVQRARTPDEIYRTVGDAVADLGYHAVVYTLTDDRTHFAISHLTFESAVVRAAEKLTGLSVQDYRFPLLPGGFYQRIIAEGETTFSDGERVAEHVAEALPGPVRPLAGRLAALLGLGPGIVAPLTVGGETDGLLMVTGTDLTEADVPAVTAFANQAAMALENARLFEQVHRQTAELEQRIAERTRDLATLYEVTAVASESLNLQTTLERSLEQVLEALRCSAGAIQVLDETEKMLRLAVHQGIPPDLVAQWDSLPADGGLMGWVLEHKEPLMVPDVVADPRTRQAVRASGFTAYVGAPMRAGGRVLGVLSVFGEAGQQFSAEDVALLASVADHVGVAVENARLRRRAEEAAVLEERQRLARELHDSVTQSLYSLTLFAEAARELAVAGDLDRVENYVAQLGETALQALKEMRLLVYQLRPEALERVGLVEALQQRLDAVEGRAGVENHLLVEEGLTLPPPVRQGLYLIAREALNNALKHAAATSVTVHIRTEGQHVKLEVVDNGRGFDPGTLTDRGGMGLISMRERAEKLGGTLTIHSKPGQGTRIQVRVSIGSHGNS